MKKQNIWSKTVSCEVSKNITKEDLIRFRDEMLKKEDSESLLFLTESFVISWIGADYNEEILRERNIIVLKKRGRK